MEQKLISISALIAKAWDLYLNNLKTFLIPMIIPLFPLTLYYLAIFLGNAQNTLLVMLINALIIIINLWIAVILIIITDKLCKNKPINLSQIFTIAFKKISSYFWVAILTVLVAIAGFILFIIPGFIFMVWYGFATFINVLEEKNNKGMAALTESKKLVQGRWWPTFWRLLLPELMVYLILIIVITGLVYVITGGKIDLESLNQALIINALITLITLLVTPLLILFPVILYNNLKETKEQTSTETPIQV